MSENFGRNGSFLLSLDIRSDGAGTGTDHFVYFPPSTPNLIILFANLEKKPDQLHLCSISPAFPYQRSKSAVEGSVDSDGGIIYRRVENGAHIWCCCGRLRLGALSIQSGVDFGACGFDVGSCIGAVGRCSCPGERGPLNIGPTWSGNWLAPSFSGPPCLTAYLAALTDHAGMGPGARERGHGMGGRHGARGPGMGADMGPGGAGPRNWGSIGRGTGDLDPIQSRQETGPYKGYKAQWPTQWRGGRRRDGTPTEKAGDGANLGNGWQGLPRGWEPTQGHTTYWGRGIPCPWWRKKRNNAISTSITLIRC